MDRFRQWPACNRLQRHGFGYRFSQVRRERRCLCFVQSLRRREMGGLSPCDDSIDTFLQKREAQKVIEHSIKKLIMDRSGETSLTGGNLRLRDDGSKV